MVWFCYTCASGPSQSVAYLSSHSFCFDALSVPYRAYYGLGHCSLLSIVNIYSHDCILGRYWTLILGFVNQWAACKYSIMEPNHAIFRDYMSSEMVRSIIDYTTQDIATLIVVYVNNQDTVQRRQAVWCVHCKQWSLKGKWEMTKQRSLTCGAAAG